jgi:twitching motility protein PilT
MATLLELLQRMVEMDGSDLHITTGTPPQIRVHGHLQRVEAPDLMPAETKQLCYSVLTDAQSKRFEEMLELDFSFGVKGVARFRCNMFNQRGAVAAVYRRIPEKILSFQDLNLPPVLATLAERPRGLVLVTGPTGSGKSTSLAAMIDYLNASRRLNIISLEDPIEFVHKSKQSQIIQRELNTHLPSFSEGVRAAMREDPDVILVGELRDADTIRWAMTAAETGHLVLGTLHTTGAVKTIDRIVDALPADEREQTKSFMSQSLIAVITQVLVKTADQRGRKAICEIMVVTRAIGKLIMTDQTHQIPTQLQTGKDLGMQMLDQSLLANVQAKEIDPDDAYVYAADKKLFSRFVTDTSVLPKLDLAPG